VLPSTLVLAVLSVHLGRRALFDDVERVAVSRGRRARSFPDDPDDALDRREHLLARAALLRVAPLPSSMSSVSAATTTQAMTLSALLSSSSSRGLLHLARSIDRAARGEPLDAYTGFLPPTVLPMAGLDGAPIPAWIVAELLTDPAKVLFRRLLGATPAPWLVPRFSPLDRRAIEDTELALSRRLTLPPGGTEQQARDALTTQLRQALADAHGVDDVDDPALAHAIALAVRHAAERAALTRAFWQEPPLHDEVVPLGHAWPWQLTSLPGRRLVLGEGDAARQTLVGLVDTVEPRAFARKETALALSAMALRHAGRGCEAIAVLDRAKRSPAVTLDQVEAIWAPALSRATAAAQAGLWSLSGSSFGLAAERGRDDDDDAAAATTGTPSGDDA
jgi:hypothetical protein